MNDTKGYYDIIKTIDMIQQLKFKQNDIEHAIILVALKCVNNDKQSESELDRNEIIANCKRVNIPYIETSAKENINVNLLFYQIPYELWIQKYINSMIIDNLLADRKHCFGE